MLVRSLVRIFGGVVFGGLLGMGGMALCALLLVGREAVANVLELGLVLGVTMGVVAAAISYSVVLSDVGSGYTRRWGDAHYRRESGEDNE